MSSVINLSQLPHLRLGREELPHKQLLLACMRDSSLGLIPGMGVAARSTFSPLFLPGGTDLPLGSPIPPGPSYNKPRDLRCFPPQLTGEGPGSAAPQMQLLVPSP